MQTEVAAACLPPLVDYISEDSACMRSWAEVVEEVARLGDVLDVEVASDGCLVVGCVRVSQAVKCCVVAEAMAHGGGTHRLASEVRQIPYEIEVVRGGGGPWSAHAVVISNRVASPRSPHLRPHCPRLSCP